MSIKFSDITVTETISGTGVSSLAPVRVSTVSAGTLATSFENGDTIDGISLVTGNRILIKNQATATENGIYIVQASGTPLRTQDFDVGYQVGGSLITVEEGSILADTIWLCTNNNGVDIVGTNNLSFIQIGGASGTGDVTGPVSSTDNAICRFDGTNGKTIQNSGVILSDVNTMTGVLDVGMSGDILDGNNNTLINFITTASAVNAITITNAATAGNPTISASGSDTNISISFQAKGTGIFDYSATSTSKSAELRLQDNTGGEYIGLSAPTTISSSFTLNLPTNVGTSDQFLRTDGNNPANLTWSTPGSSTPILLTYKASSTTSYSATVTTYTLIPSMSVTTPSAGTYLAMFNSSANHDGNNTENEYSLFVGGSQVTSSTRIFSTQEKGHNSIISVNIMDTITPNGSQNVEVRQKRNSGSGAITYYVRNLILIRIST